MNITSKHKLIAVTRRCLLVACALGFTLLGVSPAPVSAISKEQRMLYEKNIRFYDINGSQACAGVPARNEAELTGENVKDAFVYLSNDGGYDAIHAAAIVGNMMQESGVNPKAVNPSSGTTGIVQWLGPRLSAMRSWVKSKGEDPESLKGQLMYVVEESKGTVGYYKYEEFIAKTTLESANSYWNQKYEVSGGSDGPRLTKAQGVLDKYESLAGKGNGALPASTGGPCVGTGPTAGSPDCQTATGNAKILCEAKKYDVVGYQMDAGHGGAKAYHKQCPNPDTSAACKLDCSSLVSVAVFDAFGKDGNWNTDSMRSDTKNWKRIQFEELQPGDTVQPNDGHVEIVDHVTGNTIHTFGAHNPNVAQEKQVGPTDYIKHNAGNLYLRYIGSQASI